jgi:hypothetical protein
MRRNATVCFLAPLMAVSAAAVLAQDPAPPKPTEPTLPMDDPAAIRKHFETHPHEVVEGTRASSQTLAARAESAGAVVTFNGFTSVQANINGAGNNIVGDAANEPSLAIDPTNPDRIVIGWRQFGTINNNFRQAGVAYSQDGGVTWTNPGAIDPAQFRSDPVLAADGFGNFYYSSLSSITTVEVFKSIDGGVTWGAPVSASGGDKQWLIVDERTSGTGAGHVYQDWNIQFTCCAGNDFTRSINGGASFQAATAITPPSLKWGTLDVGADGTLYVAGSELNSSSGHLFTKSLDALNPVSSPTFDVASSISLGGATAIGGGFTTPNPSGLLGQVWIAAHPVNPDELYVLGSVDPLGPDPDDVMFIRSIDGGSTWSVPVRVNDDASGSNNWQWFGSMSVAPNGRIDATWNDSRVSGLPNVSALFYSFSTDGGATWSANIQVSPTFDSHVGFPQQNKLGDYYGMISDDGGANVAYAATFNGEQDVYFLRIPRDCNGNGIEDQCDVACGPVGSPCDVAGCGTTSDCNNNATPDSCEPPDDCNNNSILDICDIAADPSLDCNANLLIDSCEDPSDCNNNGTLDICELAAGTAFDCNGNGQLDECDVAADPGIDTDGDLIPDECEGACCNCATGCELATPLQCVGNGAQFDGLGTTCGDVGACTPPPSGGNDQCASATLLPNLETVSVPFDNSCASTDGPAQTACPSTQPFGADLWYSYVAPRNGTVVVSTCVGTAYDGILAVYSDGSGTCACPTDGTTQIACGDDTCGIGGGPATVTIPVVGGDCYLIRVGGWNSETGTGTLDLSYTNPPAPTKPLQDLQGSDLDKNRFISFVLPPLPLGEMTALRVRLDSLHHPALPADAPDFTAFEGESRYVNLLTDGGGNAVTTCVGSPVLGTSFQCATLGCNPEYADWGARFGSLPVHVTGDTVVPTSVYGVSILPSVCTGVETTCTAASPELPIVTGRWGDVDAGDLNVLDVTLQVDTVKQVAGALSEPRSLLRDASPSPQVSALNVLDITLTVDALKGLAYPYPIASCP